MLCHSVEDSTVVAGLGETRSPVGARPDRHGGGEGDAGQPSRSCGQLPAKVERVSNGMGAAGEQPKAREVWKGAKPKVKKVL